MARPCSFSQPDRLGHYIGLRALAQLTICDAIAP
jgi:hypothetical protein